LILCATESLDQGKACVKRGGSVIHEVNNEKCIGSLDDGSLPPFPY
jgi:hypothetical protein